ncbi:MAG TPA: ComEC/Rec2 family competence protein [Pyrinomonadaceae bacterium]|nr:ComEC/Rec2 family competence protein [Pyrinomonadaceae bacterium]
MPDDRRFPTFNHQPLLWLSFALVSGILFANSFAFPTTILILICVVSGIAAIILRTKPIATAIVLIAFFTAGMISVQVENSGVRSNRIRSLIDNGLVATDSPVELEGVVFRAPEPQSEGMVVDIDTSNIIYRGSDRSVAGRVRLYLPQTSEPISSIRDLNYGSRIRVTCRISRDDAFQNPGVRNRKEMLDRIGIDATCSVKSDLLVEEVSVESVFLPLKWIYDVRSNLIRIFQRELTQPTAGVMIASLLGNRYFLDKNTAELFREGGTFHILVISGLHITFFGGLLLFFVRLFTGNRWIQFVVTTSIIWSYTLAVGGDLPVTRAAIMFTVLLFAYVIHRNGTPLNSLGGCVLFLLVLRPSDLFDPSFQLTFVSVGSIVVLAYPLIEKLRQIGSWTPTQDAPFPPNVPKWLRRTCEIVFWNPDAWSVEINQHVWSASLYRSELPEWWLRGGLQRGLRYISEGVIVSLIVQICMLPLSIVYFHRVTVSAVFLNLWVGFWIAIGSLSAVLGSLFLAIGRLLAVPFFKTAELTNVVLQSAPEIFAENGWASFRLTAYSGTGTVIYFIYFVPIVLLAYGLAVWNPMATRSPKSRDVNVFSAAGAAVALLAILLITHPFSSDRPDGRLHVDFLDVGQGDSTLVTFPNGTTMLVDGGGRLDYRGKDGEGDDFEPDIRGIGEAVVSEVLWQKGLSHIDYIVATHADADHIQGLTDIARNFHVSKALIARWPSDDPDFKAFADKVRQRGIPFEFVSRGEVFRFGDVAVEVLLPVADERPNEPWGNDQSIVLRISMGSRSFLLTGDIEAVAERQLLGGGGTLRADVVKVPHHGSRTSSTQEFIDAVQASQAVISVGRRSPFGHPHRDVVERWQAAGVGVMTTGERGMISISTDGRELKVATFIP